jgi:hypothetical protein
VGLSARCTLATFLMGTSPRFHDPKAFFELRRQLGKCRGTSDDECRVVRAEPHLMEFYEVGACDLFDAGGCARACERIAVIQESLIVPAHTSLAGSLGWSSGQGTCSVDNSSLELLPY